MAVKTLAGVKRLTIIGVAILGLSAIGSRVVQADPTNQAQSVEKQPNPYPQIVAQNETQTATGEKNAPAPASKESETKTDEKKKSSDAKKKPLKKFRPSEKIEAEQAVDFPYDI